jgi:D-proline dehydrogenase
VEVTVIGGGIIGLFSSYYLNKEGVKVKILDYRPIGNASSHAAGLIEPYRIEVINTSHMVAKLIDYMKRGAISIKSIDFPWLSKLIKIINKPLPNSLWEKMVQMATFSLREYKRLSEEVKGIEYHEEGLIEVHVTEEGLERAIKEYKKSRLSPRFEVVEVKGFSGGIKFLDTTHVSTEIFIEEMRKELGKIEVIYGKATMVSNRIFIGNKELKSDKFLITAGTGSREFGVPVTSFKGYGIRVKTRNNFKVPYVFSDYGVALVPFSKWSKVTYGFDMTSGKRQSSVPLSICSKVVGGLEEIDFNSGERPCTPDGFPVLEVRDNIVIATGNCRLGWTFGPAMGRIASDLILGRKPIGEEFSSSRFHISS